MDSQPPVQEPSVPTEAPNPTEVPDPIEVPNPTEVPIEASSDVHQGKVLPRCYA